jgi:hypothetical protein
MAYLLACWDARSDFVELVKTPGRNRTHPQSHFHNVANAEKLAKINALHFGEAEPPSKRVSVSIQMLPLRDELTNTLLDRKDAGEDETNNCFSGKPTLGETTPTNSPHCATSV